MSITLQWDDIERTVLRFDFDGAWTAAQFDQALDYALTLTQGAHHDVYVLVVVHNDATTATQSYPCRAAIDGWPRNLRGIVAVSAPPGFQAALIRLLADYPPAPPLQFVHSLLDAYDLIAHLH